MSSPRTDSGNNNHMETYTGLSGSPFRKRHYGHVNNMKEERSLLELQAPEEAHLGQGLAVQSTLFILVQKTMLDFLDLFDPICFCLVVAIKTN